MTMRMRLQRSCDTNYDHRHKPSPITGHALVRHTCRVVPRTTLALLALAATLTAALPLAPIALIHAPAAIAKKPFPKLDRSTRAKSADRQLKRAHTHVIPDRAAPPQSNAPHAAPPPVASPIRASRAAALPSVSLPPLMLEDSKAAVLAAPPEILKLVGRHIIVGYHTPSQLIPLLERGAIGGVFVTARNARHRSSAALTAELAGMRAKAAAAGQDAFWLATDQEGGSVSRLSPPLPRQPSLRRLLAKTKPERHREVVTAYAAKQARALAGLGINLNFAPVADLDHNIRAPNDRHTRIRYRAISTDPAIVAEVARTYCDEFAKAKIYCTLKHFPGLGRIAADTHITSARLETASGTLEQSDWIPFREAISAGNAFVMIGHPHVASLDATRPASISPAVIQKLLREAWGFDGVVVTDDIAMGAIKRRYRGGMSAAAVEAINAGADLVLIGSDGDDIYDVLQALILAHEQGRLDSKKLAASGERLNKAAAQIVQNAQSAERNEPALSDVKAKTARQ